MKKYVKVLAVLLAALLLVSTAAAEDLTPVTYTFDRLSKVMEWGVTTSIDDGALNITFMGQYQSSFYAIPDDIAPETIARVQFTVAAGNAGSLAYKLHTQEDLDSPNKGGTPVSYGNPEINATGETVRYLSVMSLNDGSTAATISSVTFYLSAPIDPTAIRIETDIPDLRDALTASFGPAMHVGISLTNNEIDNQNIMALVTKHFNAVTLGNELKPDALFGYNNGQCPGTTTAELNGKKITVPVMNTSLAEKMLDAISDWNAGHPEALIKVRGHVLVWHSQTPEWFFHENYDKTQPYVTKEVMDMRQEWYIKTVLTYFTTKYKDLFYGWDVVNEAISDATNTYRTDSENPAEPLSADTHGNNSSWWKVYGSNEFIINAFRYANKYAPASVELYYNDYNETNINKAQGIVSLLKAVKAAPGTRIDGMGLQGHYSAETPGAEQIKTVARMYAGVVDKIQLTELDLKASRQFDGTRATLAAEYALQAQKYKEINDALLDLKNEGINVNGMTIWGVIDGNSWLQSQASVGGGTDGSKKQVPLLFDDNYKTKPSFWALCDYSRVDLSALPVMPDPKPTATITKGTIKVDGKVESKWKKATALEMDVIQGAKATGTVKVLWDDKNLYFLAQITDPVLNADSSAVHEQDSVEIFIDEKNTKSGGYNEYTKQYRINFKNEQSFNGTTCTAENITSAVVLTADGYIVEGAIAWTAGAPAAGDEIGIEVQINDADESGTRIGTASWNDTTNDCWENPSCFGTAVLKKK